MSNTIVAFLPCRRGSQRVPQKNIKPFAGIPFGLVQIKLAQLLGCPSLHSVVLSTNDEEIIEYARSLEDDRLVIYLRADALCSSETSTDELVGHALDLIPDAHILWTHVTSPFITSSHYEDVIRAYFDSLNGGSDSLMSMTRLQTFLWQDGEAFNYSREIEKWPRTQTLKPLYEINSGVFIASSRIYRDMNDRIGRRPYLYEMDKLTSYDIDWPEDFVVAECLFEKGLVTL